MPKVRILSGNQAGAVIEMSQPEAESAITSGFAEAYTEPPKPAKGTRFTRLGREKKPREE